jgi:hypothetical protein
MAAQAWKIYAKAKKYIGNGTITLGAGVFKMALLRNSATTLGITALSTRSTWNSIRAAEISALGGYLIHGRNLLPATSQWTVGVSTKQYKFIYSTVGLVFTASGASLKNIRFAVIRNSLTASTGRLLCYCSLSSAAFSITSPNTLTVLPAATGVFTLA